MTNSITLALAATLLTTAAQVQAQGYAASVAIGVDEIVVGESLNTNRPGYVYVYRRDGAGEWMEAERLEASDATLGDHFGRFVASDGETLIAGATVHDNSIGAAYVFEKTASGAWRETQLLVPDDLAEGDAFGRAATMAGNRILIATWAHADGRGAVYVFRKDDASGAWSQEAKLMGDDVQPNEWFGMSLALEGEWALIGTPQKDRSSGAAYAFHFDGQSWTQVQKLVASEGAPNNRFGAAVTLMDGAALVSSSTSDQFRGSVSAFERDESGQWVEGATVSPFDGAAPGTQFGSSVLLVGSEVWIGAPGATDFEGRVYVASKSAGGEWMSVNKLAPESLAPGSGLGAVLAIRDDVAVVGAGAEDSGAGAAYVFQRGEGGRWEPAQRLASAWVGLDPITGGQVDCQTGKANLWDCQDVDMVSFLPVQGIGAGRGAQVNDVWGWTDPDSQREYAIVGLTDGTSFIDVTDAQNPVFLGNLPKTEGAPASTWRDMKVYLNHAYIVADGAGNHGMQIFDLTKLRGLDGSDPRTFSEDAHYDRIASAHNIVINEESGFAYAVGVNSGGETCGGGLHMIDIHSPLSPTFAGCFQDQSTGRQLTGYSHDAQCVIYRGPDTEHQGREICIGANENALSVADVTDKAHPLALSMASYPNVGYTHQGWFDDEHRYFYSNDELDELNGLVSQTRTLIWDLFDLDDPILVAEHLADNPSIDHNLYIRGNLMYQSNYVSGLRILDISNRENPELVGFFDTVPWSEDSAEFDGSWSNYPFFPSGNIIVTSSKEGVFILRKRDLRLIP